MGRICRTILHACACLAALAAPPAFGGHSSEAPLEYLDAPPGALASATPAASAPATSPSASRIVLPASALRPSAQPELASLASAAVSVPQSAPAIYEELTRENRAVLVTADSAFWATALVHDRALSAAETRFLAPRLSAVLDRLDRALALVEMDSPALLVDRYPMPIPDSLVEPARRAHRFVQVARALLAGDDGSTTATVPVAAGGTLSEAVRGELRRIARHEGPALSAVLDQEIDYRLFAPTGRAAVAPELARFQAASQWLGTVVFRLDEHTPGVAPLAVPPPAVREGWFTGVDPQAAAAGDRDALAHLALVYPRHGLDEMRAAALLCLLLQNLRPGAKGSDCLTDWREMDHFLQAWYGPAPDLDAPTLLDSLRERIGGKATFYNTLQFLAADENVRGWIAWLEPRLRCGSDTDEARRRRGFAFLGLRPDADLRMLQRVTAGPDWHGAPVSPSPAMTLVATPDGQSERGLPRGYDLLEAMGSAEARRLCAREGDRDYRGFDTQAFEAALLWRSYVGDRTHLWWEFAITESATPSVRKSLLCAVRLAALPTPPQADTWPNYVRQDLHALQRCNTALAAWALLRRDQVVPVATPRADAEPAADGRREAGRRRAAPAPCGYVDPFPDYYDQLALALRQMREALRLARNVPAALTDEAEAVAVLCDRLAAIARREVAAPLRPLPKRDYALIAHWGATLRDTLTLRHEATEHHWFPTDGAVAGVSTVATARGGQCLQAAVGAWTVLRTTVSLAPGAPETAVWGTVLPYSEWRCAAGERLDTTAWTTGRPSIAPSGAGHTPLILHEIAERQAQWRRIEAASAGAHATEANSKLALPRTSP